MRCCCLASGLIALTGVAAAETGTPIAQRVAAMDRAAREAALVAEVRPGPVPGWWRHSGAQTRWLGRACAR